MTGRDRTSHGAEATRTLRGHREITELAAVFLAAGLVHLFTSAIGHVEQGSYALIVLSGLLVVGDLVRARRKRRSTTTDDAVPPPRHRGGTGPTAPPGGSVEDVAPLPLWRLRVSMKDTPGRLAQLAARLAALGGDIRTVHVHPTCDGVVDELLLHVPEGVTATELTEAAGEAGGERAGAVRADVRELDDVPTRSLDQATNLVEGTAELVDVLRGLLGRIEVRWSEEPADGPAESFTEDALRVSAPGGGVLRLRRDGAAFTPAEFARSRAMASLAAACRTRIPAEVRHVTVAGHPLMLRRADRHDLEPVLEFHRRCSEPTRHQRYFDTPTDSASLRRRLESGLERTLVVLTRSDGIVAVGNLSLEEDEAELALMVRDDWQRRGIGSMLCAHLVAEAESAHVRSVRALTQAHNTVIARTLRATDFGLVGAAEPGEWLWSRTTSDAVAADSPVLTSSGGQDGTGETGRR
ncbi:N-acetylglutamate synthase-like GNAT family acetyltransferase [Saccharopolyspora lacisalsi]|uniref:N-acetylglutamate synthase-like GNAT family acetyltransferase n=1 Tax=Halosaccharopolyspora lacisalsi TaxID=1000566 RepID=A0A839DWG0_9PSEU|nr:GNAT family N-acetyltransferase [Halosaccharopolyspora lacisalsi]MBA8825363.1 N-acetylglutamate synthase-like GNAT family acetyltransferase [Halosaccharopolyspora lacisalsi]